MYPELTPPLIIGLGIAVGFIGFLLVRRPVLRRLALRQVVRRPTEALLVVLGSLLGTALIVASLTVGDSLDRSVRQTAYDVLGPVDEYVRSPSVWQGDLVATRLQSLGRDSQVDGVLPAIGDSAAAVHTVGSQRKAEPRVLVWELDFGDAARFGAPHPSGLDVQEPGSGEVVINQNLADRLDARPGDRLTFYLYGLPLAARVSAVVPAEGLAGVGVGASSNRDAFLSPGTIAAAAQAAGREPLSTTFVSNRGGVEDGVRLTDVVSAKMRTALGSLTAQGATVATPKREVLDAAEQTGAVLGSLFLFIGSFSIIAGILLLVNVFVMLADERKGQLGILRAIGLRRRRVTAEFAIEGAVYAGIAALLGGLLGIAVGRVVVLIALHILNGFNQGDNQLAIVFHVTWTSVINGVVAGFLIALAAVVLTSIRIARVNIIAAIRDLEPQIRRRTRKRLTIISAVATVLLTAAAIPAILASNGPMTYLLPTLAAIAALPLLGRIMPPGTALTGVALGVLGWGLLANTVRPHMYDKTSTATYVVLGCMLSFAAVTLISQHQSLLLRPLSPLVNRPSQVGLATRLAVAYPTAKRFRTGATLAMYSVVILVIVMLTQMSAIMDAGVDQAVKDATAGWALRIDYNPNVPLTDPQSAVTTGAFAGRVTTVAPLVVAQADGDDPLHRTSRALPVVAVGIPKQLAEQGPKVDKYLANLPNGAAAWQLVLRDPKYVLIDNFYGSTGGPQGASVPPGSTITLTDPRTGQQVQRTVAGLLSDGRVAYGIGGGEFRYPVFMNQTAVQAAFGREARQSSLLVRTAPGQSAQRLAAELQGEYLANGVVATDLRQAVKDTFTANRQFFQLMQGYLALGLLVGITSLGVVMVRAVRERRRTIGVLRALGFRSRTVLMSFMGESTFIAIEGIIIGTVLGVATTWLLYTHSPVFGSLDAPFPVAWQQISFLIGVTLLASLLTTIGPARRAARIRPAVAVRVTE